MLQLVLSYTTMLMLNIISLGPCIFLGAAPSANPKLPRKDIVILLVAFVALSIYDFCCLRTIVSTLMPVGKGLIIR